ncbi:MAG: hypothetical protein PHP41_01920, partial [Bacilli bacterium]|nr:hypothetical protein [Bacilli bacterium]
YQNSKTHIASYARFIVKKADENDPHALRLLKEAGEDLAHDVRNAVKALNLRSPIVLGFRGGFICNASIAKQEVISVLEKEWEVLEVAGEQDPIYGAFYLAWRLGILC